MVEKQNVVIEADERLNSESGNAYQFLDLWFPGASSLSEVGRDELVSWLAWAFFGKTVEEIKAEGPDAADELEALTQEIETSVATRGVKLPKGSTGVTVRRLNLDPVTSKHRPFIYYACTLIMDTAAGIAIRAAGFRRYSLGNIWYYVREAPKQQPQQHVTNFNGNFNRNSSAPLDSSSSAQQSSSAPLPPLIFVHGVGMGLATYIFFVLKLVRGVTSTSDSTSTRQRRIMLIELPHVSLKLGQENVPSVSEFVATAEAAIQRHGFGPSRWIGHSLGTCLVGAFLKAKPHLVHSVVLIDPVCFLLWEVDILENFCYRQPSTAMQDIIHYHMSQELFISHFFHRHFWWYESVLFASDIPTAMSADVFISEIDEISRASAIVPYLAASAAQPERQGRLVVHELKGEGHGGWIVRPPSQATIVAAISG
ncbi:hypothetical protein JKP88DRAFT_274703 [Tribonema minus]|uniref:AB hydrolase-1 domain-containing protein n=1 Tax=Tribonema minus TaxID=303371 RepID=A0A836CPD8_9STRA|nr:hypothetical protein JKP88DRAFT_274703 [Tribonema minus]